MNSRIINIRSRNSRSTESLSPSRVQSSALQARCVVHAFDWSLIKQQLAGLARFDALEEAKVQEVIETSEDFYAVFQSTFSIADEAVRSDKCHSPIT